MPARPDGQRTRMLLKIIVIGVCVRSNMFVSVCFEQSYGNEFKWPAFFDRYNIFAGKLAISLPSKEDLYIFTVGLSIFIVV